MISEKEVLDVREPPGQAMGKVAELWKPVEGTNKIMCTACARYCKIGEGQVGLCGIRGVHEGKLWLYVYGRVITGHVDPIEKKPVSHYRPGSKIFSIATTGCNWLCHPAGTSILLADGSAKPVERIAAGDRLWSYDVDGGYQILPNVVTHVGSRLDWIYRIRTGTRGTGSLDATSEHPILTRRGWIFTRDVQPGDEILKVWYQNTERWKAGRAATLPSADFTCGVCGETVIGLRAWNKHRGACYTKDAEFSEAERLVRAERMRTRNPMRNPEVAARALASSKARYLIDPSHGWHRNLERLDAWRHRHPSKGQEVLYQILEDMGIQFEKEFRIRPEHRLEGSKKYYVADAAVPELRLDFEVDGFWHMKSDGVRQADRIRDATLEANGWRVLRIWSPDLFRHAAAVRDLIDGAMAPILRTNKKMWLPVHSVLRTDRFEKVHSFECLPSHNYVADGVVVHNCRYCFLPGTQVLTERGHVPIDRLFSESDPTQVPRIRRIRSTKVLTHRGRWRAATKAFQHLYSGKILRIRPYYLPGFDCTPGHRVFASIGGGPVGEVEAKDLKLGDFLAIPRPNGTTSSVIDVAALVRGDRSPDYKYKARLIASNGRIRWSTERGEGVPAKLKLTPELAELLGYYCAEGSVSWHRKRPNSGAVWFSFGAHEETRIRRVESLLVQVFGARPRRSRQDNRTAVIASGATLTSLFKALCGDSSATKQVPGPILQSIDEAVLRSYVTGYLNGDGYVTRRRGPGLVLGSSSVSQSLAFGAAQVLIALGEVPRIYQAKNEPFYEIQGRSVSRANDHMVRLFVEEASLSPEETSWTSSPVRVLRKPDYTLIPIRSIAQVDYVGPVYNIEVEEDHSYTANFMAVANCQNFDISQRRKVEGIEVEPQDVVQMTLEQGCQGLAYTYNQPTIFIEFARDIGMRARQAGLINIFVSNGYDTPETVAEMPKFLDCVTVDFKGSGETNFVRKYINIPNADPIFQTLLDTRDTKKIHIEITDLIVPQVGDDLNAARHLSKWVHDNLGPDTPIHFLRFHPDYKMMEFPWTPVETLEKHCAVAKEEGLKYVYIGNVPGHPLENTYCPGCGAIAIKRYGYDTTGWYLDKDNKCKKCGYRLAIFGRLEQTAKENRFYSVLYHR